MYNVTIAAVLHRETWTSPQADLCASEETGLCRSKLAWSGWSCYYDMSVLAGWNTATASASIDTYDSLCYQLVGHLLLKVFFLPVLVDISDTGRDHEHPRSEASAVHIVAEI